MGELSRSLRGGLPSHVEGKPGPVDICVLQSCPEVSVENTVSRLRLKKHIWETCFWDVKVILSSGEQHAVLLQLLGFPVKILYGKSGLGTFFLRC